MADVKTIEISAEERNLIWDMAEKNYSGAFEGFSSDNEVDSNNLVQVKQWVAGLERLGLERSTDTGCSVPCDLPFVFLLDAAEQWPLEVIEDQSRTMARAVGEMTSGQIQSAYLPPAEGDTEGRFLTALFNIKRVRERMEEAEPRLRSDSEAVVV